MTPEQILSEEVFTIHACPGADRLAECSRQTAFRDSAADLIADTEFHAETVAALREGVRRRTATFENTERDRLAWRDRAWKAESERDAALAEVERLIADGQQDVPVVDDETVRDRLALTPLGWIRDKHGDIRPASESHSEHIFSGDCAVCRCGDRPEALDVVINAVLAAAPPIVDDATRQEVEALIAAIRAMRPDPNEPCPPGWDSDDRQGDRNIYRAAELLAAAYLGRTDGND